MPTITDEVKNYPKGYRLLETQLYIPSDAKFVIAEAADNLEGKFNDPGSYVSTNWANQVQLAANAGVKMFAMITLRVNGTIWPIDYVAPDKDNTLLGILHALNSKTYEAIFLNIITEDSDWATAKAVRFYRDELQKRTGKRVFLMTHEGVWKDSETWQTELGAETSDWPLVIFGDYDGVVETPGFWKPSNGLFVEISGRVYVAFPVAAEWYGLTSSEPVEEEEEEEQPGGGGTTEEEEDTGQAELIKQLKRLNDNLERVFRVE